MKTPKTCQNCQTKYTIEWDEDKFDLEPLTCPFCGYEVEDEEDDVETDTNTIIGIDYSLTSPAICINNGNLMFFYLTIRKSGNV